MSPLARPDLFWSTEKVAAHLRAPNVRIVDCRFSFDSDLRAEYLAGHLPAAVHCNWQTDLSAPPPPSGHPRWMLLGPEEFAKAMSRLGIGNDTQVIGYDAEGGHHAARLWLGLCSSTFSSSARACAGCPVFKYDRARLMRGSSAEGWSWTSRS